jgi:hypothetical protein
MPSSTSSSPIRFCLSAWLRKTTCFLKRKHPALGRRSAGSSRCRHQCGTALEVRRHDLVRGNRFDEGRMGAAIAAESCDEASY